MKYYQRFRQDNSSFFVDERGNEVDEKTAKTNLQEHATRPQMRIMESLSEFDALLRDRAALAARHRDGNGPMGKTKLVEAWRSAGLSEEGARIAASVETDMRRSVRDWTEADWAKFAW